MNPEPDQEQYVINFCGQTQPLQSRQLRNLQNHSIATHPLISKKQTSPSDNTSLIQPFIDGDVATLGDAILYLGNQISHPVKQPPKKKCKSPTPPISERTDPTTYRAVLYRTAISDSEKPLSPLSAYHRSNLLTNEMRIKVGALCSDVAPSPSARLLFSTEMNGSVASFEKNVLGEKHTLLIARSEKQQHLICVYN